MCGIVGIVATEEVNQSIYDALTVLQHRGQDAAGIVTLSNGTLYMSKSNGLVRDVFHTRHMLQLKGSMGIGHTRYPTAGCSSSAEAQPFFVNSPYGIALSHNGNLINTKELKKALYEEDLRHVNTSSDSEILLNVLASELAKSGRLKLEVEDIFHAVGKVHKRCKGAYAAVAMITGYGILGFRDPNGIRPIILGKKSTLKGDSYMIASESVALDVLGYEVLRDIEPGEAVLIDTEGKVHTQQCAVNAKHSPCIFEFVYFARPDSIIDDISVYKARLRMGDRLGEKLLRTYPDHDIDVVIPIPDTSRTSALQLANKLNIKYREGFIKNRYIGRTFIMPGQKQRQKSVKQKLNAIDLEFKDKNVLLVDDSIVRGTTSEQIIQMARDAGAKKVYFASAAPAVCYPNIYGIDMPVPNELIAHNRTTEQVAEAIGADWLLYQDLEDLVDAVQHGNTKIKQFDTSCFNREYVTGVDEAYLTQLETQRSDESKHDDEEEKTVIELHNRA
jgi:amidophosphoribosyltransferase